MTGGPPVRGTKLEAWRIPPVWSDLQKGVLFAPPGSSVPQKQEKLIRATREVLFSIVKDVQAGLLETVGIESEFSIDDGRCSVVLFLPESADAKFIAEAIAAENVEAWCGADGKIRVGINPWYSTKDVDQTVLSAVKVVHVLLGLHAAAAKPQTIGQKIMKAARDILLIQNKAAKKTIR